uniref:Uncharacterized protein n=1 Tax=Rhizophora mucronata TaxID=61149 RepID=A0A2P2QJB4_RHIMU
MHLDFLFCPFLFIKCIIKHMTQTKVQSDLFWQTDKLNDTANLLWPLFEV